LIVKTDKEAEMAWPQATDYNAAIQNPQLAFSDPELQQGQAAGDVFGLPRPHAGSFADVYQMQCPNNQAYAVKCFTREVLGLQQRYQAISDHLKQVQRAFTVEFHYLEQGIRIRGQWYPILKMRWVEGFPLNDFLGEQADKAPVLERLAQLWVRLAQELREARLGHGDLQHGNVLLVPGRQASLLALRLIDYDGMFVPALADKPSAEVGHPNYQHPQRLCGGCYNSEVDRFSHLLIYTALRCLTISGRSLWKRYDNGENLLFREEDFREPHNSKLLHELWKAKEPEIRALMGQLLLASRKPLAEVPLLDDLVGGGAVASLTLLEEAQVHALLEGTKPSSTTRLVAALAAEAPHQPAKRKTRFGAAGAEKPAAVPFEPIPELPVPLAGSGGPDPFPYTALPVEPAVVDGGDKPRRSQGKATVAVLPAVEKTKTKTKRVEPVPSPSGERVPPKAEESVQTKPAESPRTSPCWLRTASAAVVAGMVLTTCLLWFSHQGGEVVAPPPQPRLLDLAPLTMRSGETIRPAVLIDPRGCTEPLVLQVDDLPAQVWPEKVEVAPGQDSAFLVLHAEPAAEAAECQVVVSLWKGGQKVHEQPVRLTVKKFIPPQFLKPPSSVTLKAGEKQVYKVVVDRKDCTEPLTLHIAGLPSEVKQVPIPALAGPNVELELEAPANAKLPDPPVFPLSLRAGTMTVDTKSIGITLVKDTKRVKLQVDGPLTLQAGGLGQPLEVGVDRQGLDGPIDLKLSGLPSGFPLTGARVPAGATSGHLRVQAGEAAAEGTFTVQVQAWIDEQMVGQRDVQITVQKPVAGAPIPARPVQQTPPLAPARVPRKLPIQTADHVTLKGTFYPSSNGKNVLCVLLLHDILQSQAGWKDLALALQARGYAVFSFDFRGHGGSKAVAETFWQVPANQTLTVYKRMKKLDGNPQQIDVSDFPPTYFPWLVNDLAAVKLSLDRLNDLGEVNSSNLVLIGAGQGATLGALWLASECARRQQLFLPNLTRSIRWSPNSEARHVVGAIWLGMEPTLADRPIRHTLFWLHTAGHDTKVPMHFVWGKEDARAAALTAQFLHAIGRDGKGPGNPSTAIPGVAKSGEALLQEGPMIEKVVLDCLQGFTPRGIRNWSPSRIDKDPFLWVFGSTSLPAKLPNQTAFQFVPVDKLGVPVR
jgi:hypothetical protein